MTIQQVPNFNEALLSKLVTHFGVTRHVKDGGYILPDGRLLNLQRSDMENRQFHRAVAALMPEEMIGIIDEITIVNLMASTGAIRYEARGRVHVAVKPTQLQRRKLFDIMKYSVHSYRVLVSDLNGATIGDQMFQSPHAHELLDFFNRCFSSAQKQYRDDEFYLSKELDDYIFTFRPEQRQIGRYKSSTKTFTILPEFEGSLAMFKQQVTKRQQQESVIV
ncbi:hypothetical protein [Photobacterium lipolyticum]|uniref:Uncharacterized protein n=1 Tax=Photobacterium lipolyticum TaxID=266810 RepID=A0A2T3N3E5_9GAMM|nr:hypothetical protein [Photobacterium lipolyticum]PSW06901.1 hypothetical protein C9I89_05140 [Photobacterium lipolyticum]